MLFYSVCLAANDKNNIVEFPSVAANVAYSNVAKLKFTHASDKWSYGNSDEQFVLFWPSTVSTQSDVSLHAKKSIVFIHGGCWLQQYSIDHSYALTTGLSQQGFDVYSIEYRRTGSGGEWPVALHDVEAALSLIIKKLPAGQDINLLGHSAGGHLAAMAAGRFKQKGIALQVFGLAPIIDIKAYSQGDNSCQSATPSFMQATLQEKPALYTQANPLQLDLMHIASATFFAGGADTIVPVDMAAHPQANNIVLPEVGHFDWIHPGSGAFKRLITVINSAQIHE